MIDETLKQLIEFVRDMSPHVWGILLRQVYAIAISDLVWGVTLIVLAITLFRLGVYCKNQHESWQDDWNLGAGLSWIGSGMAAIMAGLLINDAVLYLVNPEYYAIRLFLQSVGGL